MFIAWKPLGKPPAVANLALGCVLIAVWLVQAGFNAWQDWSTSRVMASIGTMLPDQCTVIRNGSVTSILAQDMVPGDIVVIKQGNKLPADIRFFEVSDDAMFDRAILTGKWYSNSFITHAYAHQEKPSRSKLLSITPKTTTSKPTTSVYKELIASLAAAWASALQPAMTPSSVASQGSHQTLRPA